MQPTLNLNCYEFFRKCTAQYGEYDAVEHFGKKTKASEFIRDVDGLAAYFQQELQLKRGDVYTVFLPTCVESFAAFYALNKIGVIVNFIHPLSPPHVLQEMMTATDSKGIMVMDLLSRKYVDVIQRKNVPCMVCSFGDYAAPLRKLGINAFSTLASLPLFKLKQHMRYEKACRRYPAAEGVRENGSDVAVYLCGGGTTGKSKTIKLSSKAINELVYKFSFVDDIREPGVEATIAVLPLFHAFGLCVAMHLPMCFAGRVIPMANFNAKSFNRLMHKNKIILIVGIPVMYRKLKKEKNFKGEHLKSLRLVFCGGDDVSETMLDDFNECLGKWGAEDKLYRGYGLTEVASACAMNTRNYFRENSIGKPLHEVRMEIWDENKKRVPFGEVGEIAISGSTVMEGYFTKDGAADDGIYTDEEGVRWVLSGDLGYEDEDGYFYFSGRKKRLIIISGYNVYPFDVEKKVEELPYIREVCAVQSYTAEGKPIVKLCISLREGNDDHEKCKQEILALCEADLPSFSVPRDIVIMGALPRTPMQKIDFIKLADAPPLAVNK